MNKTPWLNYLFILVKIAVFVVACYFIYQVVDNNLSTLKTLEIHTPWLLWSNILLSTVFYLILMMALVLAWLALLKFKNSQKSAKIYFKSQILKYLPGNVFHFAYRHSHTKNIGFGHYHLVKTAFFETFGLVTAAILLANVLLLWPSQVPWIAVWVPLQDLSFYSLLLLQLFVVVLIIQITKKPEAYLALSCYLIYFIGMGLIAKILTVSLGFYPQPYLFLTACFAASWFAGYVIPGAPGGMGVREAAFIFLASPQIMEAEALILIALMRLISITSEILMYFIAPQISHPYRHLEASSDKTVP